MSKLELINNPFRYKLESNKSYIGIGNPFRSGDTFVLVRIEPNCNYIDNYRNDPGITRRMCEECTKKGTNYRIVYKYLSGGLIKIRPQHRFILDENYECVQIED